MLVSERQMPSYKISIREMPGTGNALFSRKCQKSTTLNFQITDFFHEFCDSYSTGDFHISNNTFCSFRTSKAFVIRVSYAPFSVCLKNWFCRLLFKSDQIFFYIYIYTFLK